MVPFLRRSLVPFLLFFFIQRSFCSFVPPSLGGSAESGLSLSDITQRKSGAEYVALDNGHVGKEGSQAFDKGESGSHGQKEDAGRYSDEDSSRKGHDVGRHSLGQTQAFDQGNNAFQQHGSGQHKKGYHKSGFSNNYHKDESGNKASFYEDSDDDRGHRLVDNRDGYYGQKAQDAFRDGRQDTAFTGRNRGQHGLYDNGAGYNNRRGHAGGYDDNRYYDDRRNYLQDGSGRIYDRNGNEAYYRREQPYHHPVSYGSVPLVSGPFYSRDYLDAPPRYYRREVPYLLGGLNGPAYGYRYFPDRRDYHRGEAFYPDKGGYGGGYGGDYYGTAGHNSGYSNGYKKGYLPIDAHAGFRRTY